MTPLAVAAAVIALVAVSGLTGALGMYRHRSARPTTDLQSAARGVTPWWNASAVSGEYLSAAAYLGTAGLVLAHGADMLWLPIAGTAGYVLLLAFVTAPLRRSGAYTVSDFAEWRLGSRTVRRIVTGCVCAIGGCYLLAQFQGAGVTLHLLTGMPLWTGWAAVAAAVALIVLYTGARSITAIQAVQFWVKLAAVAVPAVALLAIWNIDGRPDPAAGGAPHFERTTRVQVHTDAAVTVPAAVTVTARGRVDGAAHHGDAVRLTPGRHTFGRGAEIVFPAGAPVPHPEHLPVQDGAAWSTPFGHGADSGLLRTGSMLLCVLLGTMGLPHILMRFHASTSASSARRTAALVPCLLALFSVFPILYGTLGRLYAPELLTTGATDATLLLLPQRMAPGPAGTFLTGLITAGAFAAFIATSCGIVVAIAGTLAQGRRRRGGATAFRAAVVITLAVPPAVLPHIAANGAATLVMTALCVSACTLCPLLVLGIWWRGLTPAGAAAGLLTGACLTGAAGAARLLSGWPDGHAAALAARPALLAAPAALAVMVTVSLLTRHRIPRRADQALIELHVPGGEMTP